MTFTLAITNYNRFQLLKESFAEVIDDPRIGEILIVDDCSEMVIFEQVMTLMAPKVKIVRQPVNRGMSLNKAHAVALSTHDWVILFDSDNSLSPDYLDALPEELYKDTIYMPSFAKPEFNFKKYEGLLFDVVNVKQYIRDPPFNVLLNCCNYVVHKETYGQVYREDSEVKGADTISMAKNWLKAGKDFYVVPGMEYNHRVHKGSEFMKNVDYNIKHAERIKREILSL